MAKSSRGKSKTKSTKRPAKPLTARSVTAAKAAGAKLTRRAADPEDVAKKPVAKAGAPRAARSTSTPSAAAAPTARAEMKNLLGGKGANLAEMASLGLPVPPGFTITTEVCTYYYDNGRTYPAELEAAGRATTWRSVEGIVGRKFGDPAKPLLVSVRSGARASMPGMMDTVLNLGLNDETVAGPRSRDSEQRALRLGLATAASSRCTATSCSA